MDSRSIRVSPTCNPRIHSRFGRPQTCMDLGRNHSSSSWVDALLAASGAQLHRQDNDVNSTELYHRQPNLRTLCGCSCPRDNLLHPRRRRLTHCIANRSLIPARITRWPPLPRSGKCIQPFPQNRIPASSVVLRSISDAKEKDWDEFRLAAEKRSSRHPKSRLSLRLVCRLQTPARCVNSDDGDRHRTLCADTFPLFAPLGQLTVLPFSITCPLPKC